MHRQFTRVALVGGALLPLVAAASSHREAPSISGLPRLDATDFYMFRSYESGRSDYVTLIANYVPFQDPQGGPNFYPLEDKGYYYINVVNNGGSVPNMTFEFRFQTIVKKLSVEAGGAKVPVSVYNIGPITTEGANLNTQQSYSVYLSKPGGGGQIENRDGSGSTFYKPADNVGEKSIPDYAGYANKFVYEINIPGCPLPGRVFVGQRKEGFFINVGEVFDLVNLNPIGPRDGKLNDLTKKNITSIALEVPIKCLTAGDEPVIGGYTTADMIDPAVQGVTPHVHQVSRLGMPLVNELVIGLPDKDKFNASHPAQDTQFLTYVTNPSFPVLLNSLFGKAANAPGTPRNDLVAVFLTGVPKLNQPKNVTPAEMMRLNTSILPTAPAKQNDLGVLGGDLAGFPNGRRPYDDVVDVTLRVAEGAVCGVAGTCGSETKDPNNGAAYTDGARAAGADEQTVHVTGKIYPADTYLSGFPYLNTPLPGSPQGAKP